VQGGLVAHGELVVEGRDRAGVFEQVDTAFHRVNARTQAEDLGINL
jgi:hypothetical protein